MTLDRLQEALSRYVFRSMSELMLATGIERALKECGIDHEREVILASDIRLDFLVEDVAIELKIDGSLAELTRQVHRYLQNPRVGAMLVVTTRSKHRDMPSEISGKPVRVHWIHR